MATQGYYTEGKVVNGVNTGGGQFVAGPAPQSYNNAVNQTLSGTGVSYNPQTGLGEKVPPTPITPTQAPQSTPVQPNIGVDSQTQTQPTQTPQSPVKQVTEASSKIAQPQVQTSSPQSSAVSTPLNSDQVGQKYIQGFGTSQVQGTKVPQTGGDGRALVSNATQSYQNPSQPYQPTPQFMTVGDPIMKSFVQTAMQYQQEVVDSGYTAKKMQEQFSNQVQNIDLQAANIQNIMNGTRDDIRAELGKAGAFVTESQVEGLVTTRNRDLLKQYNNIELQKQTMQNQMNLQVGLAQADHQYAVDKYNEVLSTGNLYKGIYTNATDQVDKLVQNVGYQGLAAAYNNDPYALSLAEQHLSMPPGTLTDPNRLQSLDTYRQQSLAMANTRLGMQQERLNIYVGNNTSNPQSTNAQLNYFSTTGQVPTFKNAAQSNAFWQSLGAADPNTIGDAAANKQLRTAMGASLTEQTKNKADVSRAIDAADKNFGLLLNTFSGKVNNKNSPLANEVNNLFQNKVIGNSDVINFQSAVSTLQTEYSNVLGRGGTVTDSVRNSAQHVVNGNYSLNDLSNLHDYIVKEGKNVVSSYDDTINSINQNLKGLGKSNTQTSQPKMVKMIGPKGTFNVPEDKVDLFTKNGYK